MLGHLRAILVVTLSFGAWMTAGHPSRALAATELRLEQAFLGAILEKLPPSRFEQSGQYRGTLHSHRLIAIDPSRRRLLIRTLVDGEYRPPVPRPVARREPPVRAEQDGFYKFAFQIKAGVNIEAGPQSLPRFRVEIEEIKRTELEGFAGVLAKILGSYFDDLVTQIAEGKTSLLNQKLNAEVLKKAAAFRQYGALCGIEYGTDHIVLQFDVTRLLSEGVVGYVYATPHPGTQPLFRWFGQRSGTHFYSTTPEAPPHARYVEEGIACHVPLPDEPGTIPVFAWHRRRDHFYTTASDGEGVSRRGYRAGGIAWFVYQEPRQGTVPLYRFLDPRRGTHFYSIHPHAEFAK